MQSGAAPRPHAGYASAVSQTASRGLFFKDLAAFALATRDDELLFGAAPVSYTHLTLPTNREV